MILVISHDEDDHARAVLDVLGQRSGPEVRMLDVAQFPSKTHLTLDVCSAEGVTQRAFRQRTDAGADNSVVDSVLDLQDVRVVWWRRPQPLSVDTEIEDQAHAQFAYTECFEALSGLWLTLDAAWVNEPRLDDDAGRKAHQLALASRLGLQIPRTRITSDPQAARKFAEELGPERTIYKAFSATEAAWRETRVLAEDELTLLDDVRFAPVIFQEFVEADLDIRVTVIGKTLLAAQIDATASDYPTDYRMVLDSAHITPHTLPLDVQAKLLRLMDELGLEYGAIDLRVTPAGEYVFLEVNPSGQWLFMEHRTGLRITEAFVDHLTALHDQQSRSGDVQRTA